MATEQELIMKFSAAIKRAESASRALLHVQRNWAFNALADTMALSHTMAMSLATRNAMNDMIIQKVKESQ